MNDENDTQNEKEDKNKKSSKESSINDSSSDHLGTTQKAVCQQIVKTV
jgi:hypothetical protein